MSGPFFRRGAARDRSLPIEMTGGSVYETAPPGTPVGLLVAPSADWTLHLADSAGGRFALDGVRILTGATRLSRNALRLPTILVTASNGTQAT